MGKASIILALGVTVLISFLIIDLNANNSQGIQSTVDFYDNTKSRLIANSGVEIYLEKLRRDKTLHGNFRNNKLASGTYDVSISGPDSAMEIKSIATFDGVTHEAKVTAKRSPIAMPNINAALYVTSDNMDLNLNGNMSINGNDTNIDGSAGPKAALPGVAVDTPADSADFINDVKPKMYGSIEGAGGDPSIHSITDTRDWTQLAKDFIFAADINLASGTYSNGTQLGTWDSPKITVVNGDVHLTGNADGYGIMIVNGNLTMSGNFTFKGIVIAYGESKLITKTVGNAGIYGGAVFVGKSVDIQATGNAKFFYSSQALENAQTKLKSSRFDIEDWWE